jgi:ABC-type transport system involved in multi-copper enzyme maturation permease subunit
MIGRIARKEIQHNFYSIRFPALMVVSAVLFVLNAVIAVTEPVQEIPEPRRSTFSTNVIRRHNVLQFCARDAGADRTQEVTVWIGGNIRPRTSGQYTSYQLPVGDYLEEYALPYAERIDWVFIIKIIFSLFAIIFTFDSVCGEREQGTLTLMCANSVSRSSVLLGKYLGALGTLLIPFIMGLILNLLIIASGVLGTVSLQTEHWLRIGILIVASVVYISLFVFLGLLVSASVHRSSSALLFLLAFWVALVIIHPNFGAVIARNVLKIETRDQLRQKVWAQQREGLDELLERFSSGKTKTQEEFSRIAEEVFSPRAKRINDMESDHRHALAERRRLARRIAMASPAAIYQYIAEAIADSGFERQQRLLSAVKNYYPVYENYVREKVGKVSPLGRMPTWRIRRDIDGERVTFETPSPQEYEGDMSDFPYFTEPKWSVIDSLRLGLSNLAALFLWNVLLFVAAHYVFVKRDLR